jgi:hypothetical protein
MHTISVYESSNFWGASCSCGWNQYGYSSEEAAWGVGFAHRRVAEEEQPDSYPDDPYIGY